MAGASLHDQVVSNHVIRIAPRDDAKLRSGYLLIALAHPTLGRPLIKALPFGSSVPEVDPTELEELEVVRLKRGEENAIADLAEESTRLRARADVLDREMSEEADRLIDRFVAGDMLPFVITMPATATNPPPASGPSALPEHARVRLLRALPAAGLDEGAAGTIVHVYRGGAGYEVEFTEGRKHPIVETLSPEDLEELTDQNE